MASSKLQLIHNFETVILRLSVLMTSWVHIEKNRGRNYVRNFIWDRYFIRKIPMMNGRDGRYEEWSPSISISLSPCWQSIVFNWNPLNKKFISRANRDLEVKWSWKPSISISWSSHMYMEDSLLFLIETLSTKNF